VVSTRLRSFVKALTWETSGILTFALIGLLLGDAWETLKLGVIYFPVHTSMYFVHERIWKKVKWGHAKELPKRILYECPVCRPPVMPITTPPGWSR
jgi:uncharacterized membrane protein